MHGHKQLAGFIVHRIGDSLDLCFQSFVQSTQRLHGLLKTAMRHLERGKAFCKETNTAVQRFSLELRVCTRIEYFLKRSMVKRDNLQQALALRDGAPAHLVGKSQRGLAAISQVFEQCRLVLLLERFRWLGLGLPRSLLLHGRIPAKRATRTSASSVPL